MKKLTSLKQTTQTTGHQAESSAMEKETNAADCLRAAFTETNSRSMGKGDDGPAAFVSCLVAVSVTALGLELRGPDIRMNK